MPTGAKNLRLQLIHSEHLCAIRDELRLLPMTREDRNAIMQSANLLSLASLDYVLGYLDVAGQCRHLEDMSYIQLCDAFPILQGNRRYEIQRLVCAQINLAITAGDTTAWIRWSDALFSVADGQLLPIPLFKLFRNLRRTLRQSLSRAKELLKKIGG